MIPRIEPSQLKIFIKKYFFLGLFSSILSIYFFFGCYHLTQFITADEHYWIYERIPAYWQAWQDGKPKKTFINDKPGVSLALVSGIALLSHPNPADHCTELANRYYKCHTEETASLLFAFRFPILLFNGLILVYLFGLIRKLTNRWIALWTITLTALSPIILGISQIINPDALLWSTSTAGLLSFYAVLKFRKVPYIIATIVFTTLALLSKYTALILLPFFVILSFIEFLARYPLQDKPNLSLRMLARYLVWVGIIGGGIGALSILALPAILANPSILRDYLETIANKRDLIIMSICFVALVEIDLLLLRGRYIWLFRKFLFGSSLWLRIITWSFGLFLLTVILSRWIAPAWHIFSLPFDLKDITDARYFGTLPNLPEILLLEWSPVVFSLTPIALIGLSYLLVRLGEKTRPIYSFLSVSLIIFLIGFTALLVHSNVLATARYVILFYPLLALLASIGFWHLADRLLLHFPKVKLWISLTLFVFSLVTLTLSAPFYFNYTNFLLPKNSLIHDAWGYGGYEAAQYLNQLPDAKNLTIWADYYGVCEFFVGNCVTAYTLDKEKVRLDYYVLTRRGKIRYMPRYPNWEIKSGITAYRYYADPNPLWSLEIGDRPGNYVKVYKVNHDFRASIITDIDHCPSREGVSEANLNSFLSFSRNQKSDLVISLGDNASHRLRNCSLTGDEDVRFIAERLRTTGLPTHLVLGDHDIASSVDSYQAWLATTERDTTYYSFDTKGIHVIVLDTVLGGDPMRPPCSEDISCSTLEKRLHDVETLDFSEYRTQYPDILPVRSRELAKLRAALEEERQVLQLVRSFGKRDQGRIGEKQLAWLQEDLKKTPLKRVVIFSDHPLFPFSSDRKNYSLVGSDVVLKTLELSEKEIVAISGEAHTWYETTIKNIQFYIIDEFRKANGSWAYFTWDTDGFHLEKITHE